MATSLENLGNEFETTNHENTITAEKNWKYGAYDKSYGQFYAILAMKSKIQLPWQPPL